MNVTAHNLETWLSNKQDDLSGDEVETVESVIALIRERGE